MSDKTTTEDPFMDIMDQVERQYTKKVDKCWRLQALLDRKEHECRDLEHQRGTAIKLLDVQKQKTRLARREKEELIDQIRDIVFKAKASADRLSAEELRQKLSFLYNNNLSGDWDASLNHHNGHLSAIKEVNSTGSILSDCSCSRSEDDLDSASLPNGME